MSEANKELEELEREHRENEITDKEYEERKAALENKDMPKMEVKKTDRPNASTQSTQNDPKLKTIRNLLIALVAIMVIGFGSIIGYIIYTETAYSDDFYYDDSGYEEYYEDDTSSEDGTITDEADVAFE